MKVEWGKQIKNKWKQGGDVDLIVPVIDNLPTVDLLHVRNTYM